MFQALPVIGRLAGALAGIATLGLCVSPAWSACSPAIGDGHRARAFVVEDGIVVAKASGLVWQRCSVGQKSDEGHCSGTAAKLDWAGAQLAAAAAGHGWRLPTQAELAGLVLRYCSGPATDTDVFPDTPATWFWSSTADGARGAWFVDFEQSGGNGASLKSNTAAVRLVRQER